MTKQSNQQGFTIIELLLAMGFVSALLLGVAMTILQIGQIYNRGITLNETNQAGRVIAQNIETAIQQSSGLTPATLPSNSTLLVTPNSNHYRADDFGGRLCVGQFSYIWNYGKTIDSNVDSQLNKYGDSLGITQPGTISFLKIADPGGGYCRGKDADGNDSARLPLVNKDGGGSELLAAGDHDLAVHSLKITTNKAAIDTASNQILYTISFVIGTNNSAALVNDATGTPVCRPPSDAGADLEYCSVEKFTIAVRASNAVN